MDRSIRTSVGAIVVSASTLVGIASHEGYSSAAYYDSGHVATYGFGETKGATIKSKTDPVRALQTLSNSIDAHVKGMDSCIKVPLYTYEFNAYVDFTYNVGVKAFCTSTLVKKLNTKDYAGACSEILRWNRVNGKIVNGLIVRRKDEYDHCRGLYDAKTI